MQSAITPTITPIGSRMFPVFAPKNALFIMVSPCVSGKNPTIRRITAGMTSKGSVVPEKISIGK